MFSRALVSRSSLGGSRCLFSCSGLVVIVSLADSMLGHFVISSWGVRFSFDYLGTKRGYFQSGCSVLLVFSGNGNGKRNTGEQGKHYQKSCLESVDLPRFSGLSYVSNLWFCLSIGLWFIFLFVFCIRVHFFSS
ncbi:hypothetical protein BP00DRAFT_100466 [Aspergillus indologenus CBS 114.80]|uniref:Uncharacterized protein n=1 Tax=Aspergillus indologenus CBS 114.80 TaxID=1450541 RepID=A0A2V5HM13_9EURO|nr:hypothetical protein BP00DRAFT_100466 [Aspergillus indologenus CBS 114.80]